jgi:hypothetical protein
MRELISKRSRPFSCFGNPHVVHQDIESLAGGAKVVRARNSGAGWNPARRLSTGAFGLFTGDSGRVSNPPQVSNLPHNSGKSMRLWAKAQGMLLDRHG